MEILKQLAGIQNAEKQKASNAYRASIYQLCIDPTKVDAAGLSDNLHQLRLSPEHVGFDIQNMQAIAGFQKQSENVATLTKAADASRGKVAANRARIDDAVKKLERDHAALVTEHNRAQAAANEAEQANAQYVAAKSHPDTRHLFPDNAYATRPPLPRSYVLPLYHSAIKQRVEGDDQTDTINRLAKALDIDADEIERDTRAAKHAQGSGMDHVRYS